MGRRRRLALGILVLMCAGCGGPGDAEESAVGSRVFAEAGCAGCHTLADAGATGRIGPNLDDTKPDTLKVVRQLMRGGNGMPSFKGRLSDAEMRAVAGYVSEAAAKSGGPVSAEFRPQGTRLRDCRRKDADPECYAQALGDVVYQDGVDAGLEALQGEIGARRMAPGDCHRVLHTMGAAAVARYRGNVARAFIAGSAVCASGYYHGVLERGFRGVDREDLPARAAEMCADEDIASKPFLQFQCLHGLGHGLMLQTSYDLPFALRTCESLGSDFAMKSCGGGVFMENFTSSYGVTSPHLREDNPVYPCDDVGEVHKFACYQHVTIRILRAVGRDERRIAEVCRTRSDAEWVHVCMQSLGRDIASLVGRDLRETVRRCAAAGDLAGECMYGVARDIANTDADVARRAAGYCNRLVPEQYRRRCWVGLGVTISSLEPPPAARRRACRRLAGAYAVPCLKGAGLPPA